MHLHSNLSLFYLSDYQDLTTILPVIAPELVFALHDFTTSILKLPTMGFTVGNMYDTFLDAGAAVALEALDNLLFVGV